MDHRPYHLQKISDAFSHRQKEDPRYTLRAFSRDIELNVSSLSQILRGFRPLPVKSAKSVAEKLALSPTEKMLFLESALQSRVQFGTIRVSREDHRRILDDSHYKVIAEWEHFAVLALYDIFGYLPSREEIAEHFDLTITRTQTVLQNLLDSGILVADANGKLIKSLTESRTTEDIQSQALRESHLETLRIARLKLEEVPVDRRDFSSMTLAIDMDKLLEAKMVIREFRRKMEKLLENNRSTEVYQLAIQFFPLSKKPKNVPRDV